MTYSAMLMMLDELDGVSVVASRDWVCIEVAEDGEQLDDLFAVLRGSSSAYTEEEYRTWHYTFDGFTVDLVFAAWEE